MAGAGRRTFTPGEVLTASNVMNYLQDQAVMNFAGTAARGSAIGTAVSEGMVSYLQDSNVVQAYDGSAWNSLAYATAVPTLNGVGLVPVAPSSVTIAGGTATQSATGAIVFSTGTTSMTLNGIFTSAYRNYRVVVNVNNGASGTDGYLAAKLTASGTASSTSYDNGMWAAGIDYSYTQSLGAYNTIQFGLARFYDVNSKASCSVDFMSPQLAQFTQWHGQGIGATLGSYQQIMVTGLHKQATSYDGLYLWATSNTISGQIAVFGYND